MANVVDVLMSSSISRQVACVLLFISLAHTQNIVVFQPSYLTASGPTVTALLLGNTSDISLNLRAVSPSNKTGSVGSPSCVAQETQWVLTREQVGKTAVRVQLRLGKNLRLCGENETDTDCCPKPLCVVETLQVSACVGSIPQASLLIQAKIYALLVPANAGSGDVTVDVIDEEAIDLGLFIPSSDAVVSSDESLVCDNVTVALDYRVYWRGNGITNITLTRTVGTITLKNSGVLITRYSAMFLNGEFMGESNSGNPVVTLNSSTAMEDTAGSCYGVPSHQHIHVRSLITGLVDGVPQRDIRALQVSYSLSPWTLDCGGGDVSPCVDPMETQLFPITSSVTFTDIPINTGSPKTRFQINFTEYDCSRNDVCWPELAFPITKYYTGEPYSQSLAKGLILVFFFIAASILGTPWRQIRQAWSCVCL
ncbi:Tectonic-2 Precursor [Collichthys lucidus]|uniref:Tectonic-2 n=1 Tax=Collichthys lucidus TaxID=240159 RepID=A0A4U5UV74_COLLU|nr:Tectonic-2 Precursor [Collichthys lucidus]